MEDLIDDNVAEAFGLDMDPWDDAPESGEYPLAPTQLTTCEEVRAKVLRPGTFRLVSQATGAAFTFRVSEPATPSQNEVRLYVGMLTGAEERHDYIGTVWTAPSYYRRRRYPAGFRHGRRSNVSPGSPAAKAVAWLYARVLGSDEALESALRQCEVWS